MEAFITGIVGFLGDNPAFLTFLIGLVIGFILGLKNG